MGYLTSIKKTAQTTINNREKSATLSFDFNAIDEEFHKDETVFLPYQLAWMMNRSPIVIDEKSRQIGWSWVMAGRATINGIEDKRDSLYTSYNKESAKQFIKDCRKWAKIFNVVVQIIAKTSILKDSDMNVFEIRFSNGRSVQATAGNSENLRAKPGYDIYLDELAYRQESLEDIFAAASATLIGGGTIRGASTHAGIESEFNVLCESIKKGETAYGHSKVTFRQAIKEGLYKRLCIRDGKQWSAAAEKAWIDEIYSLYGIRASEELDAEPGDFSGGGKVFNSDMFERVHFVPTPDTIYIRYYDLASSTNANACYSASVKFALNSEVQTNNFVKLTIVDYFAEQLSPIDLNAYIRQQVRDDDEYTFHIIEKEPGSGMYAESLKDELEPQGFHIYTYAPRISKLKRALPASNAVVKKEINIDDDPRLKKLIDLLTKFDGTEKKLVNDVTDCVSGVFDWYRNDFNGMYGS